MADSQQGDGADRESSFAPESAENPWAAAPVEPARPVPPASPDVPLVSGPWWGGASTGQPRPQPPAPSFVSPEQPAWASPSGAPLPPPPIAPTPSAPLASPPAAGAVEAGHAPGSFGAAPPEASPWPPAVDLGEVAAWPPPAPVPAVSTVTHTSRRRRRRPARGLLAAGVACLLSGLLGGGVVAWLDDDAATGTLPPAPVVPAGAAPGRDPGSVAAIAARVLPSIVAMRVTSSEGTATGSGFVIRPDGYLLTNNHVVASAPAGDSITVIFQDGTQVRGSVVGRDASYDLAVVKIRKSGLVPLALADSSRALVGDPVIAVGAPLGLQGTVTTGIISALNRPVAAGGDEDQQESSYINAIQTDAAINPGNSGGPLLDASGTVIGINSAIARASNNASGVAGSIGLGFAIPSNQARRTSEQLIRSGKADHPVIGVLLDRSYQGEGVKIAERASGDQDPISAGGPADRAGLQAGDVIVAFNGRPVAAPDELVVAIRAQAPGDVVRLTVRRDGRDREIKVKLEAARG